jgi:signal transduction histidine kinase
MAASEYADPKTPPDRRKKLNDYLVGSASKFMQSARRTVSVLAELNASSKNVVDMVSEFERYATRKVEVEPIEVLPVIKATVSATTMLAERNVEVVMPNISPMVLANSIILRQIFSNVFVNAAEAMEAQSRRGRIAIAIDDAENDVIRIAISDNGEGIDAERLSTIFQKGSSTRSVRSRGLGLHWCANATQVLGGTIAAASKGIGCGTTITIELRKVPEIDRKAA